MKTSIVAILFSLATSLVMWAGPPAIKVIERHSDGGLINTGSVEANDDTTRVAILKLWKEAKEAFPKDQRNLYAPNAAYVEITITNGEEAIVLRSWHPLYENGKLVVTSNGLAYLNGRKREDVLKADKEWYQEARKVFDQIVKFTKSKAEHVVAPNLPPPSQKSTSSVRGSED